MSDQPLDPTIMNILQKQSLKWIFVGGKGGVGKTTCSCSIAVQMAKVRESVLIISTDPAHNLSDAFNQKFTKYPTPVKGFTNLQAMEIDPTIEPEELEAMSQGGDPLGLKEMAFTIPGIDEAMSFAEVMKQVQTMEFSTIIFDTAPTGHTLRFLSFPSALEKGLGKIFSLKNKFGAMFSQISSMFPGGLDTNEMAGKFESTRKVIEEVNSQFKNPDLTTFIPVMIPEFLSLYETERLIQELAKFEIDVENIIINQILHPDADGHCGLCVARSNMQNKYLSQADILYGDFHLVKLPLLQNEIRGVPELLEFSKNLMEPYTPDKHNHNNNNNSNNNNNNTNKK